MPLCGRASRPPANRRLQDDHPYHQKRRDRGTPNLSKRDVRGVVGGHNACACAATEGFSLRSIQSSIRTSVSDRFGNPNAQREDQVQPKWRGPAPTPPCATRPIREDIVPPPRGLQILVRSLPHGGISSRRECRPRELSPSAFVPLDIGRSHTAPRRRNPR